MADYSEQLTTSINRADILADMLCESQLVGVGFIHRGNFQHLFNALLPADGPSHEFGVNIMQDIMSPS